MLGLILGFLVLGLIAGALGRLLVPGRQPLGCFGTIALGLVGSFVGGFLGYLIFGHDASQGAFQPSGIIGSVIGSVIVLVLFGAVSGRRR